MTECLDALRSLDDLRTFIHTTLCNRENILAEQFAMTETQLTRGGQSCGLQFSLQGPRSVRLNAIWVADHNLVYFYDARGSRFLKIRLKQRLVTCAA